MNYIYHLVPKNFTGTVLYPLNELMKHHPEVYTTHIKKYEGRQVLLERKIPILNCLWNDVLHFSPVHPQKIRAALFEAGFEIKTLQWFEINPESIGINTQNTMIYLSPKREQGDFSVQVKDFELYEPKKLAEMSDIPAETMAHFKEAKEKKEQPFLFNHIPHVLFRGMLETENVKVIKV